MSERQICDIRDGFKRGISNEDNVSETVARTSLNAASALIARLIIEGILAPGPNWEDEA